MFLGHYSQYKKSIIKKKEKDFVFISVAPVIHCLTIFFENNMGIPLRNISQMSNLTFYPQLFIAFCAIKSLNFYYGLQEFKTNLDF